MVLESIISELEVRCLKLAYFSNQMHILLINYCVISDKLNSFEFQYVVLHIVDSSIQRLILISCQIENCQ